MAIALTKQVIKSTIPDDTGCYAIFDACGNALYVGRSNNLRVRIMAHFIDQEDGFGFQFRLSGTTSWHCKREPAPGGSTLEFWIAHNPKQLERELIREFLPSRNTHTYSPEW